MIEQFIKLLVLVHMKIFSQISLPQINLPYKAGLKLAAAPKNMLLFVPTKVHRIAKGRWVHKYVRLALFSWIWFH